MEKQLIGSITMMAKLSHFLQTKWKNIKHLHTDTKRTIKLNKIRNAPLRKIIILTVPNTLYIAKLLQHFLDKKGITSKIITQKPFTGYENFLHIVIAAHAFKSLPSTYIAFQLEQYVSGVYDKKKRLKKLQNAILIIDYSLKNIQYLLNRGFKSEQLYHVPIAQLPYKYTNKALDYSYDIVFYGDINIERRQRYLNILKQHFKLHIITNAFGEDAIKQLSKAKIVINIHYYEDALLETTRLFECISNGLFVISEHASDMEEHNQLLDFVDFVEIGNINRMVERINYWLNHESERQAKLCKIREFSIQSPTEFDYHFEKALSYVSSNKNSQT